jgi:hypothetical protein
MFKDIYGWRGEVLLRGAGAPLGELLPCIKTWRLRGAKPLFYSSPSQTNDDRLYMNKAV